VAQQLIRRTAINSIGYTTIDIIALALFFTAWISHGWVVNNSPLQRHTISYKMRHFRKRWMLNMVLRETKMVDALIQNTLQYGVLFFASTSVIVIGALMAGLGAADQALELLQELPFAAPTSKTAWETKVLLVVCIFAFAFFKFAWSHRTFNYILILIGGAPDRTSEPHAQDNLAELEKYADKLAQLHTLSAKHFTTGLNAYFFAMAAIGWFLNPWLFITTTVLVTAVLYRRAFRSNFMNILSQLESKPE